MYYSRTTDNKDLLRIAERAALSLGALGGWVGGGVFWDLCGTDR